MAFKSGSVGTAETDEVTVSPPTGMAVGDLLLAWLAVNDGSGAGDLPTGWTLGSELIMGSWDNHFGSLWSPSSSAPWLWNMNKTVTSDDLGESISMGSGGSARKTLVVLCYSNLDPPSADPPPGAPATTAFTAEGHIDVTFGGSFGEAGQLGAEADGGVQDPAAFQIAANTIRRDLGWWTGIPQAENQSFTQAGGTVRANVAGLLPLIVYEGTGTTSWAWDDSTAFFQGRMLVKPLEEVVATGWGVGMVRMGPN